MSIYKYNVKEILNEQPQHKVDSLKKQMATEMNITYARLWQMINIKKDDKSDWSGTQLKIAARILDVTIEDLYPIEEQVLKIAA